MAVTLYYIHDPMCSWCWGYRPVLGRLLEGLPPAVVVVRLLGGLAPDDDSPMSPEMTSKIRDAWRRVQERIPGTRFNFDFWDRCQPRRSTYRACRAVIAARHQDPRFDEVMTHAIQRAYYLEARNPSDRDTLIGLAEAIGADGGSFAARLDATPTQAELEAEIGRARAMGVDSFPSLVLDCAGSRWRLPVDYTDPGPTLELIRELAGPA